jgi:hypothetical protein
MVIYQFRFGAARLWKPAKTPSALLNEGRRDLLERYGIHAPQPLLSPTGAVIVFLEAAVDSENVGQDSANASNVVLKGSASPR